MACPQLTFYPIVCFHSSSLLKETGSRAYLDSMLNSDGLPHLVWTSLSVSPQLLTDDCMKLSVVGTGRWSLNMDTKVSRAQDCCSWIMPFPCFPCSWIMPSGSWASGQRWNFTRWQFRGFWGKGEYVEGMCIVVARWQTDKVYFAKIAASVFWIPNVLLLPCHQEVKIISLPLKLSGPL